MSKGDKSSSQMYAVCNSELMAVSLHEGLAPMATRGIAFRTRALTDNYNLATCTVSKGGVPGAMAARKVSKQILVVGT